jgi:hypothetical protein
MYPWLAVDVSPLIWTSEAAGSIAMPGHQLFNEVPAETGPPKPLQPAAAAIPDGVLQLALCERLYVPIPPSVPLA